MKTLIFSLILSLFIHAALLFNYNNKNNNSNSISSAKSYVSVEIMHLSQGVKQAEDISGVNNVSQKKADNNIKKEIDKSLNGKSKNIKKQEKKSELKTAKKGNEGYEKTSSFINGYASYVPEPKYPLISRRNKEEGSIIFNIKVDNKGNMTAYKMVQSSGYKRLDKEAEKSIKTAKFQPALKNGEPVSSNFDLKITFTLQGS